jgi:hypothetical protein
MVESKHDVSEKDIFDTVEFLIGIPSTSPALLFKIGRMVNKEVEYEKEPIGG